MKIQDSVGKSFELAGQSSTIADVKQLIEERTGLEKARQRLFWSGDELSDNIECCSLQEDVNNLILRLIIGSVKVNPSTMFQIEELRPNRGFSSGGQVVRIYGQGWEIGNINIIAKFGEILVPTRIISSIILECIAPPHSPGPVTVEISHDGVNFTNNQIIFTYVNLDSVWESASIAVCGLSPVSQESCKVPTVISYKEDNNLL